MPPIRTQFNLGVYRTTKAGAPPGALLKARNSRYLDKDADWLQTLLGRAAYNANPVPNPTYPGLDDATKRIFGINYDDGTAALVQHKNGSLFEGDLDAASEFTEAYAMVDDGAQTVEAGNEFAYSNIWFYIAGIGTGGADRKLAFARPQDGTWRMAGHRQPTDAFTAAETGSGSFSSTYAVKYLYRIYDDNIGIESQRSSTTVEVGAFTSVQAIRLTWASGITQPADLGTHVRIYRTFLSEPAGIYTRVDGNDAGIPIANFIAGYQWDDNTPNDDAQINGVVKADGTEGQRTWAEHGGPVPEARGAIMFRDHAVYWGNPDDPNAIIYSAQGFPESIPVDFDGLYVYKIPFQTKKQDEVRRCHITGNFLVVLLGESIFRVQTLPTFAFPGFDTRVMVPVTEEDGSCGADASCSFGTGANQAQVILYMSRRHGPVLTDGVYTQQLAPHFDWPNLVEPAYFGNTECIDYASKEEVWVFYTPTGETTNTQAFIIDYSNWKGSATNPAKGLRITWPVDVKNVSAYHGTGTDGIDRLYIADAQGMVFVQDSGNTDAQENTNPAGDIVVEWFTPRYRPTGQGQTHHIFRGFVYGAAGVSKQLTVRHYAHKGDREDVTYDWCNIGAGETSDTYNAGQAGTAFREELEYTGPTGSSYDEDDADRALSIFEIEYEAEVTGLAHRTR
jgi:hypothetical protein